MKYLMLFTIVVFTSIFVSCDKKEEPKADMPKEEPKSLLQERIDLYANTDIKVDISQLSENDQKIVKLLIEAGKIADEIFWKQTSPCAIAVRDSLRQLNTPEAKEALEFTMINYGPYDRMDENKRYFGIGPEFRPKQGSFYPPDITKEEFENYIKANPKQKAELEGQYTVVVRDGNKLKAVPYSVQYPEVFKIADLLEQAARLSTNPTFTHYLMTRAMSLRTNDYFPSDIAWMEITNSDIDFVIGPIENYEDGLYNYKTAFEAVVMIKDHAATKELEFYNQHVGEFEKKLPYDQKYIRKEVGKGTQINFVNVAFFGGDCQKGSKTIANSLPNDERVRQIKGGGKNSMFKNMMEAKFDKIVVPIGQKILDEPLVKYLDKKSFMSFVTLHEVSHTLGRGFVFGNDKLTIRQALKERYSPIEECKADILGMHNLKHLLDIKVLTQEDLKKSCATYLAGLYRSLRFGSESAHGRANLIQLNFLREAGAITKLPNGKFSINFDIFFDKVAELANLVLTTQAEGNYKRAGEILDKYAVENEEIKAVVQSLNGIPRDLNTKYFN